MTNLSFPRPEAVTAGLRHGRVVAGGGVSRGTSAGSRRVLDINHRSIGNSGSTYLYVLALFFKKGRSSTW